MCRITLCTVPCSNSCECITVICSGIIPPRLYVEGRTGRPNAEIKGIDQSVQTTVSVIGYKILVTNCGRSFASLILFALPTVAEGLNIASYKRPADNRVAYTHTHSCGRRTSPGALVALSGRRIHILRP